MELRFEAALAPCKQTGEKDHAWQHDAKQTIAIARTRALLDTENVAAVIPECVCL